MSGEDPAASGSPAAAPGADELVRRVAQLTRTLRQSMRELGLDQKIERAAAAIPDARDRLGYVARMTARAAERSLNAIDRARPLQVRIGYGAETLAAKWQAWADARPPALDAAPDLVSATRAYLCMTPELTRRISAELLEITLAQDFQDLTGQVIDKLMDVIRGVEQQLLQVLLDSAPEGRERDELRQRLQAQARTDGDGAPEALVNGPQVRDDIEGVVSGQDQVDALLDELGF